MKRDQTDLDSRSPLESAAATPAHSVTGEVVDGHEDTLAFLIGVPYGLFDVVSAFIDIKNLRFGYA